MHLGRGLMADDARTPGGEPVAVLTHQAWTRLFDADPAALGGLLTVNGQKLTIVGVMAPEFTGLDDVPRDVWVPLTMYGTLMGEDLFGADQPRQLKLTARLRNEFTPQQAQGALQLESFETRVAGRVDAVRALLQQQATPMRMTLVGVRAFLAGARGVRAGARRRVRECVERDARSSQLTVIAKSASGSRSAPAAAASSGNSSPRGC